MTPDKKFNKGLFLNLPNRDRVMRRYMCSYNSPGFLFQPIELISLAAVFRDWKLGNSILLDAIAEGILESELQETLAKNLPDFIVCLSGFECFQEDIEVIDRIKEAFPQIIIVLFGHYATEFHEVIMESTKVDYIIHGEPDLVFSSLIDSWNRENDIKNVSSISYRIENNIIHQKGHSRILDPNQLPMPAFDLLKNHLYGEPFFSKPYGLIQSARGCPYQCNYCVRSYGVKLTALTPENIILQLEKYIELFHIKSYRFIDDTFTANPKRIIAFCKLIIEKGYQNIKWSCLSRPDTLDEEMLHWMKKAGCIRIYIGIESGSQKVLDFYNKRIDVNESLNRLKYVKSLDIELMGFFMIGAPNENKSDVDKSIRFSLDAGFDFITVGKLTPYPGTHLFETLKNDLNFSLLPYKNEFINASFDKEVYILQKYFYRNFYLNPRVILNILRNKFMFLFGELRQNAISFTHYLLQNQKFKKRKDFV